MIAVIDYDTGNLRSVANALGRLGAEYRITASPDEIRSAERVLLPGVGEASTAMEKLRERGLVETIRSLTQPVLGICIGVQLLCRRSEEGDAECIGIFDNEVRKFTAEGLKVPHMGWNSHRPLEIIHRQIPAKGALGDMVIRQQRRTGKADAVYIVVNLFLYYHNSLIL